MFDLLSNLVFIDIDDFALFILEIFNSDLQGLDFFF